MTENHDSTMCATATPLDNELIKILYSVSSDWSIPSVWTGIWKKLSKKAGKFGFDERTVRRRTKFLWENVGPTLEVKKEEENQNLKRWVNQLHNGKWNYAQWDDFLDSLDSPIDITALEKARDLLINNVYIDPLTDLMWSLDGNIARTQMSWDDAMSWVKKLKHGGYSGWRLPSKDEFEAFVMRGGRFPSYWFYNRGFTNVQESLYWSSTLLDDTFVWLADLKYGGLKNFTKNTPRYVWPVRIERVPK